MNERILVTGSSGFIGRSLIPTLQRLGYTVAGLDVQPQDQAPAGAAFYRCNLLDRDGLITAFRDFAPTIVVHLAARTDLSETEGLGGYAANTTGTRHVVDAVVDCGTVKRVLFTSSQLVCAIGYVPSSDTDYKPMNLYGQSKVISEQIVRQFMPAGITWCLMRPTTIWGEGTALHYQRFLRLLAKGRYFHVGNGRLIKSYGYVGNCVHQIARFIAAPPELIAGKTFYLADYAPISLREWIDELARGLSGKRVRAMPVGVAKVLAAGGDLLNAIGFERFPFNSFRLNNILTEYVFDLSPTERVCGPLPYTMKEGVVRTVQWFKQLGS